MKTKLKKKPFNKCCYGISSECGNKTDHVFMIDYDGVSIGTVIQHLQYIQKEYSLSNIYVIKSSHGFNAMSLDIMALPIIYSLGIDVQSPADHDFFKYGYKRNYYVLRFDKDKELVTILTNKSKREKSLAHKLFLEWYFDIKIEMDNTFNNNSLLKIIQYPSKKNGYHLREVYNDK